MLTLLVAVGSFLGFIAAYHSYGRWLGKRIFNLDNKALVPSRELQDDIDFVPTKKSVIFGHHFTSIAGTGPIVGPAIAVFWGWLPALLWVVFGSIFIGAVHDFGSLVVSLRNKGQTVGEIAGRLISPRAKVLFLLVLFLSLTIVLAIFGLVIASIFKMYPESVLSVWIGMPLAVGIGFWVHKQGRSLVLPSIIALLVLYGAVYLGAYHFEIAIPNSWSESLASATGLDVSWFNPVVLWTAMLMVYCFIASVLPVWMLLQPRDYINSHQLFVALSLLTIGLAVAGLTGQVDLAETAPAVTDAETRTTAGVPPMFPFLFITIACGAVSGFHCLVASGTTSKQVACEDDARMVGYGAMLLEGALAVIVILACCSGVGMGKFERIQIAENHTHTYEPMLNADGEHIVGRAAWEQRYDANKGWASFRLGDKVGAFIEGGANFISAIGLPLQLAIAIVAVLVASFAATTLDTATRLQRYVIQELATSFHVKPLANKYVATAVAVSTALAVAFTPGPAGPGSGGLMLWPLFGATNQLLAGLAFMVIAFYLWRRNKPIWFIVLPLIVMVVLPAWAMLWNMFNAKSGWYMSGNYLLVGFGVAILGLQLWMVIEAILIWPRSKGVLEEQIA